MNTSSARHSADPHQTSRRQQNTHNATPPSSSFNYYYNKAATDLPQALFGAWDWRNYQTTLGAMLTICIFTFSAGTFAFEDPVQRTPAPHPTVKISQNSSEKNDNETNLILEFVLRNFFGFARSIIVSLTCATQGELTLFLSTMLMSCVDLERVLGSIKLREALIILGLQRILLQQILSNVYSFLLNGFTFIVRPNSNDIKKSTVEAENIFLWWSFVPSAAWMAVTVAMMRRILVPPRRCFRLFGLPLDEQTLSDVFVFQILLVSQDSWCFVTCALVSLLNCSRFSPIHLRSRFFPRLWEDDVEVKEATVLARFLPNVVE